MSDSVPIEELETLVEQVENKRETRRGLTETLLENGQSSLGEWYDGEEVGMMVVQNRIQDLIEDHKGE